MKRKLLLAALIVAGALGFNANAQKDVTSQYIKNATLSSLDGWTVKSFNNPVRGNNTAGFASEVYAGWEVFKTDPTFSLTQKIKLPKGNYTLVSYSFFRSGGAYNTDATTSKVDLKAGEQSVKIKTLGSITAAGYANSQAEGANVFDSKMYRNTLDFEISTDDTEIEIGLTGTFEGVADNSWCIAGMFELIDKDQPATMDSPFDVTGYITNPGFEYRDMTGWILSGSETLKAEGGNQNFKVGGWFAEKWYQNDQVKDCSMSQTISDLPAGYYELTAYIDGDGTYIDLNGKTVYRTETDGNYTVGYVLKEKEELVITAGKTAEGATNWVKFDNFRLSFKGDIKAAYETAIEQAKALLDKPMNNEVKNTFASAISENEGVDSDDADDYVNAIGAINVASEAAKSSIAMYETVRATLDAYAEKVKSLDKDGQAAYDVAEIEAAYTGGTIAEDQTDAIVAAFAVATKAQTTAGADFTGAIINWDFLNCNRDKDPKFPGWTIDAPNGGNTWENGDTRVEYWIGSAVNGKFDYYQEITGLPVGKYTISASMWNSTNGENGASVNENVGVYGESGSEFVFKGVTVDSDGDNLNEYTTEEIAVYDGTLRLGVKNNGTMGARWFGVDWIKLKFVEPLTSVTVNVTDAGYATFSTGIALDLSNIKDGKAYIALQESDGETITLEECKGIVPANTGLVIAGEGEVEISFAAAGAETIDVKDNLLVATDGSTVEDGNYVLATPIDKSEAAFYVLEEAMDIEAGKAYLKADAVQKDNGAKVIRIVFGDENATAIETVATEAEADGALYNVAGQQVGKDYKGIVIKNGKKYLNK